MRPTREHATNTSHTCMVTSSTWGRRALFARELWAGLLIDTLYHYRGSAYLLHEFVVMPDHMHVLVTPLNSLEKAVQFIKGGFSYRTKKELGSNMEVWQKGFSDHRIRDEGDYLRHVEYIRQNPVRKRLCERAEEYPYSSAVSGVELDPEPQGLKPESFAASYGAAEAAPFQNESPYDATEGAPFQHESPYGAAEGAPFQHESPYDATEGAPFQNESPYGATEGAPFQNENPHDAAEGVPFQGQRPDGATPSCRPVTSEKRVPSAYKNKIA